MDPQEIEQIEFKTTRLKEGYDSDEVDAFLDRVAAEYAELHAKWQRLEVENASLKRRLDFAKSNPNPVPPMPSEAPTEQFFPIATVSTSANAVRLLEAAQKTADDAIAQAEEQGQKIVADAMAKAGGVVDKARAQEYAAHERLNELKGKHEDLRAFLKQHLESGLAELEANTP